MIVILNHSCFKVIGLLAITVLTIGCSEERPGEALPKITVEGKVIREGTAEEIANDEMVRKYYLGDNFRLAQ